MTDYMAQYIELCYLCNQDRRNIGNMLSIVIPCLQREASKLREAVEPLPVDDADRRLLEGDAEVLEAAVRSGLQRCRIEPEQQELFAA
jgi:hypothetical protein